MLKKINIAKLIAGAMLTVGSSVAHANNFNYNFFEFRTAISPQTFGGEYSANFTENSHFVVRMDSRFESDYDTAVGVGFNGPMNQFGDIYGQVLLHHMNVRNDTGTESDTRAELNVGFRLWLTQQVELTGRVGKLDERSVFHAGVRFHSTQQLSLSAETRNNGIYGPQITMSVRFQY
ncbi:hypothetical protein [Vibrio sp.]|uniref:hypothetical protein n=1 Tax=Vibrio sp. TaxID=678 RepID=UPI003D0B3A17